MRGIMNHSNMLQTLEDHNNVDDILKSAGIPFVEVRPAMLKGDQRLPVKVSADNGEGVGFMPPISANSVANFVLVVAEHESWNGRTPVISNRDRGHLACYSKSKERICSIGGLTPVPNSVLGHCQTENWQLGSAD